MYNVQYDLCLYPWGTRRNRHKANEYSMRPRSGILRCSVLNLSGEKGPITFRLIHTAHGFMAHYIHQKVFMKIREPYCYYQREYS